MLLPGAGPAFAARRSRRRAFGPPVAKNPRMSDATIRQLHRVLEKVGASMKVRLLGQDGSLRAPQIDALGRGVITEDAALKEALQLQMTRDRLLFTGRAPRRVRGGTHG